MKIWPECIPCVLKMSLDVIRTVTNDEKGIKRFLTEILELKPLRGEDYSFTSPELTRDVWSKIVQFSGKEDPLKAKKDEQNRKALDFYPVAREIIQKSRDPILEALKFAILGNSIDSMVDIKESSTDEIMEILHKAWIDLHSAEELKKKMGRVKKLIYLGDNCGEIVFDKLFIEMIQELNNLEVIFITRTIPVLNDALFEDALSVGMNEVATVMENGILEPLPGTFLGRASKEVRDLINDSNLIISKGLGNFDTLSEDETLRGKLSFLLRGKCYPSCAAHNVSFGSLIVHHF
ncbi:MAG: hypothetical protein A2V86_13455 [Deltaproteobacteria bacterium RBG_16_49_23]|nr:MAG: hypothetical protein A2V86_13455 [Deltaproteobacteria bacterium RBG_16_49_23]